MSPLPPRNDPDGLGATLQELLRTLQENGRNTAEERRLLTQKMDDLSRSLNDVRREQQSAIDSLRRDFERLFVSHAEYDPKHQIVLDKIREYDAILASSRAAQEEYVRYKAKVDELRTDLEDMKKRQEGAAGRILPWISIAIAIASVALTYLQHIPIH